MNKAEAVLIILDCQPHDVHDRLFQIWRAAHGDFGFSGKAPNVDLESMIDFVFGKYAEIGKTYDPRLLVSRFVGKY